MSQDVIADWSTHAYGQLHNNEPPMPSPRACTWVAVRITICQVRHDGVTLLWQLRAAHPDRARPRSLKDQTCIYRLEMINPHTSFTTVSTATLYVALDRQYHHTASITTLYAAIDCQFHRLHPPRGHQQTCRIYRTPAFCARPVHRTQHPEKTCADRRAVPKTFKWNRHPETIYQEPVCPRRSPAAGGLRISHVGCTQGVTRLIQGAPP